MYPHWNTIQLPWKSGNTPNILVSKVCLDHVTINMFWPVSSLFYLRCRENALFFQPCNSLKNTKATVENNTFPSSMKWLCHMKQQPNSLPKNQIVLCSTFRWPILTLHKLHPVKNTRNSTTNCVILVSKWVRLARNKHVSWTCIFICPDGHRLIQTQNAQW